MTKRLAFLSVGVAVAAGYPTREPVVSQANLSRIKRGMTRSEVEAILGKAAANVSMPSHPGARLVIASYGGDGRSSDALVVQFDDNGVVEMSWIEPCRPDDRSLWERLRDRVAEL
jgi:outer membrane protein assembly factor BamE (lipoprotein component of BamABCDE complex)